jgi:coenzyme F420-dependent glucose-6-phosphate dehydrogenase
MATVGYAAMFEQFTPSDLLDYCRQAERAGFGAIMASDHFHPWTPQQGQSGFVWSWLGALGATTSLRFGTGVTPPGPRYHPAIIAQAAATVEQMFPGRFYLGLGAGEALNEHITGQYWPEAPVRLEKLAEGIEIIKRLFSGKVVKYRGRHFTLESAKLYTRPDQPPPIYVATAGPIQSERTGKTCDGIITVGAADEKIGMLMARFEKGAREAGKDPAAMPRLMQVHVSWAETLEEATDNAMREWPNGAQRRDELPQGRHPQPGGLRGDGPAGSTGELQEPRADLARPRRAPGSPAALRRPRLRRDLRPQRRTQPGGLHPRLRGAGDPTAEVEGRGARGEGRNPRGDAGQLMDVSWFVRPSPFAPRPSPLAAPEAPCPAG